MATYTITLNTPETRVYIYPPFTKPVKYIELLECYAPSGWYTLKNAKIVLPETVNDTETSDLEDGSYSPKAFQKLINTKGTPKFVRLFNEGEKYYIYSNFYKLTDFFNRWTIEGGLGLPRNIEKNTKYYINAPPKKSIKIYCDLVDENYSYESTTADPKGGTTKINRSHLLAIVPSERYPRMNVASSINPINYFTVTIYDEDGEKLNLVDETIKIQLKLSF